MGDIFFSDLAICFGKLIEKSQSRLEFRDLRNKILDLVSRPRFCEQNSRSRLEARDSVDKISFSSRGTRLKEDNSRSRLETQNRLLANDRYP